MGLNFPDEKILKSMDSSMINVLFPKKKRRVYSKNRIYVGREKFSPNFVCMDMTESKRMLIMGGAGSGKTWHITAMMSRAFQAGIMPFVIDIRGEYYNLKEPAKDTKGFLSHEKPTGLPLKIYYPNFFKRFTNMREVDFDYIPFSFGIFDLNVQEFCLLAGIRKNDSKKTLLEKIWKKWRTINGFKKSIEDIEGFNKTTKTTLLNIVDNLVKFELIGEERNDINDDISKGYIPVVCFSGWNNLGDHKHYMASYIAIMLRRLYEDLRTHRFGKKKVLVVFEEMLRYIKGEAGKEIAELVDMGRREGMSVLGCVQRITKALDFFMPQCHYVMLSSNIEEETMTQIFKQYSLIDEPPIMFRTEVRRYKREMQSYGKGKGGDWMFIDVFAKDFKVYKCLNPLCDRSVEVGS